MVTVLIIAISCDSCETNNSRLLTLHLYLLLASLSFLPYQATADEFNLEVGLRVRDSIKAYMNHPPNYGKIFAELHENHLFEFSMTAPARASCFRIFEAVKTVSPYLDGIYYRSEDGILFGLFSFNTAFYRKPVNSGYQAKNLDRLNHYRSCVDPDGSETKCTIAPGGNYIQCIDECEMEICPNDESQRDCYFLLSDIEERPECDQNVKWCKNYKKNTAPSVGDSPPLGFITMSGHCYDLKGAVT